MRAPLATRLALLVALAACVACGGAKKDADSPANAEDDADGGGAAAAAGGADLPAPVDSTPSSSAPVAGDDTNKKASPCGGFEITDLATVLAQSACEVPTPASGDQKDLKDILEIKVMPDSPRIAPGATATVTVTFKNKSQKELPLDFVVDPEPRFGFEVYTVKGVRVDKPKGSEPSLPPEVANAAQPETKTARVKLAPLGTARVALKWNAVKYKWASKDRAKGALPGHGYPKDPAGPLTKGSYVLRVLTPLTGVFEGIDHEVSQPRVQITVGGMP